MSDERAEPDQTGWLTPYQRAYRAMQDRARAAEAEVERLREAIDAALSTTWTPDENGGWGTDEDTLYPDRLTALAALQPHWQAWGDQAWAALGAAQPDAELRVRVIGNVHDWLVEHFPDAVEPFKVWAVGVAPLDAERAPDPMQSTQGSMHVGTVGDAERAPQPEPRQDGAVRGTVDLDDPANRSIAAQVGHTPEPRHDRDAETVEVGCARRDDGRVSWELRVNGVAHGQGNTVSASHALLDAGFALRDEAHRQASVFPESSRPANHDERH